MTENKTGYVIEFDLLSNSLNGIPVRFVKVFRDSLSSPFYIRRIVKESLHLRSIQGYKSQKTIERLWDPADVYPSIEEARIAFKKALNNYNKEKNND